MRKAVLCVMLVALIFTQGCCSIFKADPQTISITSNPPGAKVEVGPHSGTTPFQVSVPKGKDYVVTARYEGETKTVNLSKSIEPVYWVNILFWPGLIVDLATGKMFKYDPTSYSFDFSK